MCFVVDEAVNTYFIYSVVVAHTAISFTLNCSMHDVCSQVIRKPHANSAFVRTRFQKPVADRPKHRFLNRVGNMTDA